MFYFFFFQAEDGIRDYKVTGVQTCALPIYKRSHLFAQIETMQSVENLDAICAVEGLSGVFIGPGDLSVSIGATGELDGDRMIDIVTSCVRRARAAGKHAGILVPPGRMLQAAVEAGCDLVFYCGDVSDLGTTWMRL